MSLKSSRLRWSQMLLSSTVLFEVPCSEMHPRWTGSRGVVSTVFQVRPPSSVVAT
jgi:hypothetical protein